VTDVIDGPLGSGQPVRDELPTAECQASAPQADGQTCDDAQSANHSADTRPLAAEPAAIPLRQRLASAGPGRMRPVREKTLVLETEALLSGPLTSGPLTSGALASRVLSSGALASELQASSVAPAPAALPGDAAGDVAAPGGPEAGQTRAAAVALPQPRAAPDASPAPAQPPEPLAGGADLGPVLPVPPRDDEKYRYIKRGAWILTLASAASFPLLLFSQTRLMLEYHWFWFYLPFVIMGALFLALPMLTDGLARGFDFGEHQRLVNNWRPETYPSVDVFLPVCGEPVDVVRNTWKYVAEMSRHYQGTVTAYVLDDSASPELKAMARTFGFAYARRPNRGWFKKSGNLWFGFQISYGDYILLLDADFAPRHDLLNEALPYMEDDPKIGIVQTPQFFRITNDQGWVERGAGAVQELFYRSIQTARSRKGGAICVGSCAIYRRAALKQNLGMTLAEHSEDVLTGFDLNRIGWSLRYIPVALSTGNCPDNVLAFLNQQYRWCSGTVGLLFGKMFWGAKLPLYTRLCYISGFIYYIYTALFTFVVPALTIAILALVPNVLEFKNMIFMVPVVLYAAVIIPAWHHAPYRLEAWAVKLISGWAHFWAYFDAIRGKRLGWNPSGGNKKRQDGSRRFWTWFLVWSLGSSLVWTGLAFWRMITMNPYNFIVLFGLGLFELVVVGRVLLQPTVDAHK
jgi:cellulose synthase/poly-beta-1,6-N-acetylglucosamine synthase-like glycosyltransferase